MLMSEYSDPANTDLMEEFTGLFNLPGEGFVAQLRNGGQSSLYDRQGLQYLILQRKQEGQDAEAAEQALARMNAVQNTIGLQLSGGS
ncbi:MAG TPA: hypothetical protein DIC24_08215 [Gammaproteobacteria bacterium]|jgi:hypothetical protein|nr:MAG: hypothetical protein CBC15_14275 [Candidatus Endolissoclinum sp. TMED55]HBP84812.1 hypothetical protein [Gammaproteobacteria bacterium]HCL94591.1 hypothetical protein [Gammaproteobacteria bacterium]|tara:strand:- start:51 stop:311 length:261 start_codon:yes stop_codon:yes gene_type:complete